MVSGQLDETQQIRPRRSLMQMRLVLSSGPIR